MNPKPRRRPLRILLVTNHRRFKINFRAQPWASELAARGHDVDVMCHANTERFRTRVEQVEKFRVIESPDLLIGPLRQGWDPVCAWRRLKFLRRENKQYDIIHCLDTRLAVVWPALKYAREKKITIVSDWIDWWGHGGLIKERRPFWYQWLFAGVEVFFEEYYRNKLDGLTAISHALVERAIGLGVDPERCLVIPGGANLRNFTHIPDQAQSRRMLGIAEDAPVICFSGLDVLIDLPMVVKAYEILHKTDPNIVLLLVGPAPRDIKGMVSDRAAQKNIKAVGPVAYKELPNYLAAADVFLMPYTNKVSNVGRWPNKIGDYMCIGRPTVSNPIGEVRWLFERYPIGALCEETPEGMAAAARDFLNDGARSVRTGLYAREVAQRVFAWDKLIVSLENWYYALIEGRLGVKTEASRPATPLLVHQPANGAGARR